MDDCTLSDIGMARQMVEAGTTTLHMIAQDLVSDSYSAAEDDFN